MENSTLDPFGSNSTVTGNDNALQRGLDSAGLALHSTVDKVADPAHSTVDRMSTAAHDTINKLAGGASNVADKFSNQARWVSEAPNRALDTSKSWVQNKPLEAVGLALVLGFIVGRLTAH